jgi:hypothetical protein
LRIQYVDVEAAASTNKYNNGPIIFNNNWHTFVVESSFAKTEDKFIGEIITDSFTPKEGTKEFDGYIKNLKKFFKVNSTGDKLKKTTQTRATIVQL